MLCFPGQANINPTSRDGLDGSRSNVASSVTSEGGGGLTFIVKDPELNEVVLQLKRKNLL